MFFSKDTKVYLDTKGKISPTPNKNYPSNRMLKHKNIKFSKHFTCKKLNSKASDI